MLSAPTNLAARAAVAAALLLCVAVPARAAEPDEATPIDYLTFAQGAVPVSIGADGPRLRANFEHAVKLIDGAPHGFTIVNKAGPETVVEFVYALPAATTFQRFAVPDILETPSPRATFFRTVEVQGSASAAGSGYRKLASATLTAHRRKGAVTELAISDTGAVRWVKVILRGGIDMPLGEASLEFSELIGNGSQEPAPFAKGFNGVWRQGANVISLVQDGAVVNGCYDRNGDLAGTVTGAILRATGADRTTSVPSAFILSLTDDGQLRGVRSSNSGPFRLYSVPVAPKETRVGCEPRRVALGCGSVIHGINFDFDSATIRQDAGPVLAALYDGLKGDPSAAITIEGHTSSEGSTDYNQKLSERRAQSVVADLAGRGISPGRLKAVGVGEARPIAGNDDESGRAMNRRVAVVCR